MRRVAAGFERTLSGTIDGTRNWITHTFGFAAQEPDTALLAELVEATHRFFAIYPDSTTPLGTVAEPSTPVIVQAAADGSVDMARAPEKRLPSWIRMLQGHFSELRMTEDDEKFTLIQDPCGTCTRQIQQGRYDAPLDLAVIEERHATTWFRGDTLVYRAHVPLWHVTLAQELVGVPWPVNRCPAGLGTGPCPVLLFKGPRNPAAKDDVPR